MKKESGRRRVDVNLNQLDQIIDSAYERTLERAEGETLREALHALAARLGSWRNSEKASKVLEALSGEASEDGSDLPRSEEDVRTGLFTTGVVSTMEGG